MTADVDKDPAKRSERTREKRKTRHPHWPFYQAQREIYLLGNGHLALHIITRGDLRRLRRNLKAKSVAKDKTGLFAAGLDKQIRLKCMGISGA